MSIKTKTNYIFLFYLLSSSVVFAQFTVYSGGSISAVQPGYSNLKIGEVFGIQKSWGTRNLSFSSGIIYSTKGGVLKSKNFAFAMSPSGYHLDIHVSVDYLEIPLFFNLYSPINQNISVGICIGPSLAIGISDNTESKNLTYFNFENPGIAEKNEIDYWENFEPGPVWAECSIIYLNMGFIFKLSEFFIEMRYNYAMSDVNTVAAKTINERFHSVNFLIGVAIY